MTSQTTARSEPAVPAPPRHAVLLVPAGLALLAGLDAALVLLGLPAPVSTERLVTGHGTLLVLGFVATLVALERAVALGHPLAFLAPAALTAGGLALISPVPVVVGRLAPLTGACALAAGYVPLWRRRRDVAVLAQALGAVLAVGAAVLSLPGVPTAVSLPWLVGFVVLTIGGERLELARVAMGGRVEAALVVLAAALAAATAATLLWPPVGYPLLGLVLVTFVGVLCGHDVARHTIHGGGFTRFAAGCLLAGYCWLAVAGAIWMLGGPTVDGPRYDAAVHAVFLGFTFSMIMAHAPVILPAVLRRPLPYHPAMVAPAVLLHVSLVLRLWVGDALGVRLAWQIGGALGVAAVLLFVGVAVWSATRRAGAR